MRPQTVRLFMRRDQRAAAIASPWHRLLAARSPISKPRMAARPTLVLSVTAGLTRRA
jgi:hypothetical protein